MLSQIIKLYFKKPKKVKITPVPTTEWKSLQREGTAVATTGRQLLTTLTPLGEIRRGSKVPILG